MRKLMTGFSIAVLALVGIGMGGCSARTGTQTGTGADNIKYDFPTNRQDDDIKHRGPSGRGGRY